jgi:hypothetical protein
VFELTSVMSGQIGKTRSLDAGLGGAIDVSW